MHIIQLTPDFSGTVEWPTLSTTKKSVVTVGVFDGVHRGHQAVLKRTVQLAHDLHAFSVVIMFDPRPAFVHAYEAKHAGVEIPEDVIDTQALTGVDERLRILEQMHIDYVLIVHYNLDFAAKSFRFFLGQLVGKLGMRALVLGEDARMGAHNEGTIEKIQQLANATGVFQLDVVHDGAGRTRIPRDYEPTMPEGRGEPTDPLAAMTKTERRAWTKAHNTKEVRVLSSSNIRYVLSQGRIQEANELLGRLHGVEGTVVHGDERGRTIGFPTANVEIPMDGYVPVDGVYAGWLIDLGPADEYDDEQRKLMEPAEEGISQQVNTTPVQSRLASHSPYRWPAAISIGVKPTFNGEDTTKKHVLEAYAITDESPDLYGHRVRVEFAGFLRPQIPFNSADELVEELRRNVEETKRIVDASAN